MDIQYNSLIIDSYEHVIRLNGPFTQDCVAGMAAALDSLMFHIVGELHFQGLEYIVWENEFPNYVIIKSNNPFKVRPARGKYGLWVKADQEWMFIVCDHMDEFLQGYITICNLHHADYHKYIKHPIDNDEIEYDIIY